MGDVLTLRTPEAQVVHGLISAKIASDHAADKALEAQHMRGFDRILRLKMAINAAEDALAHLRAVHEADEAINGRLSGSTIAQERQ